MRRSSGAAVVLAATAVFILVCLGRAFAPESAPYARLISPHLIVASGSILKLSLLFAAAVSAFLTRDRLEPGHPARRPWGLLSLCFAGLFSGQLSLAPSQLAHGTETFPSPADVFYLAATVLLVIAIATFLRLYRRSELIVDPHYRLAAVAFGTMALVFAVPLLWPIATATAPPLEKALSLAYPALDLVALVPLAMLMRLTRRMGGAVGRVWTLLLAGCVAFTIGDVLFASFSDPTLHAVDPLLHASYVLSYGLWAAGTRLQLDLIGRPVVPRAA
jgi:hypothetical protein